MNFIDYMRQYISISSDVADALVSSTIDRRVPRGYPLHAEGEICNKLWYIKKGIVRWYYLNEDGKDITDSFASENSFVTAFDSFFQRKPSRYFIETLESSEVTQMSFHDLDTSLKSFPEIEKVARFVLIEVLEQTLEKNASLRFRKAEDRYKFITDKHPDLLQRVPLGHIASYIGITQETLSRIRGRRS